MIYITYTLLALVSLPLTLLAVLLSPILPFFAVVKEGWLDNHSHYGMGSRLPTWLNWFMTPDNSLEGDIGWKVEHWQWRFKIKEDVVVTYLGFMGWLIRNPAYSFAMRYIDGNAPAVYYGDPTIRDNENAKEGWCFVKAGGLFQYRYIKRIGNTNRCILINLGWNIMALVDEGVQPKPNPYQATFVFSPRISGYR